jgi:hypothetical protein
MMDISWTKAQSAGKNEFWLLVMDEFTNFLWSFFLPSKDLVATTLLPFLKNLNRQEGITIQFLRCDNAPEHIILQQACDLDNELNIQFEYTAVGTPQQNGKIERKFAALSGKCRAMLNGAELDWYIRKKLWAQCAALATILDNVLIRKDTKRTPHMMFHNKDPLWIKQLKPFGTMAIVKNNVKIQSKLRNRGYAAIYLGPAENHSAEVHSFYNPITERRIIARNIIFLTQTYKEYYKLQPDQVAEITGPQYTDNDDTDSDDDSIVVIDNPEEELNIWNMVGHDAAAPDMLTDQSSIDHRSLQRSFHSNTTITDDVTDASQSEFNPEQEDLEPDGDESLPASIVRTFRIPRELRNLESFNNPPIAPPADDYSIPSMGTDQSSLETAFLATIYDGNTEPKTYREVLTTKDYANWWTAMCTEFQNMESKEVWEIQLKSELPSNRKIIGARWVYNRKDDGRYRARCVAKGFSQIPGKDFQENHAPVVSDTTMHILLVIKTLFKLKAGQFDIETAFLYGELEEALWMEIPDGYDKFLKQEHNKDVNPKTQCLRLHKAIYGLVQAARQWWKKFKETLSTLHYYPSKADPCLFIKDEGTHKKSFLMVYVDDGGIFSSDVNIREVLTALSKTFVVKDLGTMETFVGCRIVENKEKTALYVHQPKLIKNLKEHFGELVANVRDYSTPAAPRSIIQRPQKGDTLISPQLQTKFRSGVGMLLYLVKHSRFDIANAVRDLSKVADGANHSHWKALMRTIKYVINTEHLALELKPDPNESTLFHVEGVSDSDYAGDRDTRASVFGYIVYFCGAPIAWKSKSSKSVTLSSTEAEYVALSEVTKEIIFIKQVLESMGINLTLPIKVKVDNVGAIYLSNNFTVSQRTKHIDVRRHYVREYVEDGIIKTYFVPTKLNEADIHTKNTSEEVFMRHMNKNLKDIREIIVEQ